jgi:hypothetical protein
MSNWNCGDHIIREIEFTRYIDNSLCIEGGVVDNFGHKRLRVAVTSSTNKEDAYGLSFNIEWIKDDKRIDWLAEVIADQLRDNIRYAKDSIKNDLRESFQKINDTLKIFK